MTEPWVSWFNQVCVSIMLLCSTVAVFLPDLGIALGTISYLAGTIHSTALNQASKEHDRPTKANLVAFTSWLVFLVHAAALRRDTTRLLQGLCIVVSFWQSVITLTWTLLLPATDSKDRDAEWEYWVGAVACAVADVYISTAYSDVQPNNEASLLLAAYVASRAAGYHVDKIYAIVLAMALGGSASAILLCSLSAHCLPVTQAVCGVLLGVLLLTTAKQAHCKWTRGRSKKS